MKKKRIKYILVIIISFILLTITSTYAANVIGGMEIMYDNSTSKLTSTNVQDAIDELYINIQGSCPKGYLCLEKKSTPQIGDYVRMTPSLSTFTTDVSKTGYYSEQTINPQELTLWRVLKINNDGTIELISEYVSSVDVGFAQRTGYKNLVGYLNTLTSKYENSKYTIGSRSLGYNGQTEYITDTTKLNSTTAPWSSSTGNSTVESQGGGDLLYQEDYNLIEEALGSRAACKVGTKLYKNYWIATRYYGYGADDYWTYNARYITSTGSLYTSNLYQYDEGYDMETSTTSSLRPIVILKSGISYKPAAGTSIDPFVLE